MPYSNLETDPYRSCFSPQGTNLVLGAKTKGHEHKLGQIGVPFILLISWMVPKSIEIIGAWLKILNLARENQDPIKKIQN